MTEKLFVNNVYQKFAELTLCELVESDTSYRAAFTETIFFPTGGGQLCDKGKIAGYDVVDVFEEKNTRTIWHTLKKQNGLEKLEIGKKYNAELDWESRFLHMQMHCGEHMLSGAFLKLFGAENRGFYMGEDHVRIDMYWNGDEITDNMAKQAEKLANEYVWKNIPVQTIYFKTAEEANKMPIRKAIKAESDISVVSIEGIDCCACCGTHPSTTGQVGIIKISGKEKYKDMTRFYVKIGSVALNDYSMLQFVCSKLGTRFSCTPEEIENKLDSDKAKTEEMLHRYNSLKIYAFSIAEKEVLESKSKVLYYEQFSCDDLQVLANKLEGKIKGTYCFVSPKENSCILTSDGSFQCGKFIKDNAGIYNGKGGGKPNLARAIFNTKQDIELFVELLNKGNWN